MFSGPIMAPGDGATSHAIAGGSGGAWQELRFSANTSEPQPVAWVESLQAGSKKHSGVPFAAHPSSKNLQSASAKHADAHSACVHDARHGTRWRVAES